jgi:hypothetical protein
VPPLRPPDGDARGVFEERERRRSVFARSIREGWTGREGLAGLSDGMRDPVREVAESGILS